MWRFLPVAALGMLCCLSPMSGDEKTTVAKVDSGPMAKSATWIYKCDTKLNGKMGDDAQGGPYQVTVINSRISMRPSDITWSERVSFAGEMVPGLAGNKPSLFLRQDNEDIPGYTSFHCGQLLEPGRIVGTWHNNRGESGDFEMVMQ